MSTFDDLASLVKQGSDSKMMPPERRLVAIRLLAEIDQRIELARLQAAIPFLDQDERH